jgi:hypothetical protein
MSKPDPISENETKDDGGQTPCDSEYAGCVPVMEAVFMEQVHESRTLRFPVGWPSGIFIGEDMDCLDDCKVLDHGLNKVESGGSDGECSQFSENHGVVALATSEPDRWPSDEAKPLDFSLCCIVKKMQLPGETGQDEPRNETIDEKPISKPVVERDDVSERDDDMFPAERDDDMFSAEAKKKLMNMQKGAPVVEHENVLGNSKEAELVGAEIRKLGGSKRKKLIRSATSEEIPIE